MKRFSMSLLVTVVFCGLVLVGRAPAADAPPDGPPPKQDGGGPGGPGGGGPGGRGGAPGGIHLIPRFAEAKLNLTDDQKKQVADLEKDCKEKLAKILTPDQMKTLEEARPQRGGQGGGPGGRGGPGGGGQGGQGGPGGAGPGDKESGQTKRAPRPEN